MTLWLANKRRGIDQHSQTGNGAYTHIVNTKADFKITARANAYDAESYPIIEIYKNDNLIAKQQGAKGGDVHCFYSIYCGIGDELTVKFINIINDPIYNTVLFEILIAI